MYLFTYVLLLLFSYCTARDQTQSCTHYKQMSYHWTTSLGLEFVKFLVFYDMIALLESENPYLFLVNSIVPIISAILHQPNMELYWAMLALINIHLLPWSNDLRLFSPDIAPQMMWQCLAVNRMFWLHDQWISSVHLFIAWI